MIRGRTRSTENCTGVRDVDKYEGLVDTRKLLTTRH